MEDPNNIYRVLIKFMDESYVDSFLGEGLLYMNNINFFKEYEDTDVALRSDIHEGLAASLKASDVVIKIGDHEVDGAIGKVDFRYNHEGETNIYSMGKISDGDILNAGENGLYLSEKFNGFGNKAVLISGSNIVEFERRLKKAIEDSEDIYTPREDGVVAKQVTYLSRDEHHGQMDVFNKFDEYIWQYEWRITFKQKIPGPYALKIGDISNIATVHDTASLISQPLRLVQKSL
ncbi:hypothetical protein JWG39_15410 [Desulforhopalus vacuolatus]|uniref:hypothetical protein n=1 Tax=Desulforhopalus vacuolatus TaxID=40414 RepID=UPI0019653DF4|nr:hypothetical protein [Desulforhopalus vacuolatus]MBM9521207.1 hypothetical protein [Desulforhopalus vacuolatus]